ncbi:MAG TPA: nitrite reductase small subunit NirD [Polyangiaceae bacterium]|nr:nitrite reductase small subunit NirD [Polyangiaceae bacterium]
MNLQTVSLREPRTNWADVCALEDILAGTGVSAIVDGEQIALVKTRNGELHAVSNFDPFSKTFVIARGIVGDRAGVPKIASPIYKQNFNLVTGECFDDTSVRLHVYAVRVAAGRIQVLRSNERCQA